MSLFSKIFGANGNLPNIHPPLTISQLESLNNNEAFIAEQQTTHQAALQQQLDQPPGFFALTHAQAIQQAEQVPSTEARQWWSLEMQKIKKEMQKIKKELQKYKNKFGEWKDEPVEQEDKLERFEILDL